MSVVGVPWLVWAGKCLAVGTAAAGAGVYAYRFVAPLKPGQQRAIAALPVFALLSLISLVFDRKTEILSRGSCACMLLWLANLKLALFVLNRGPLALGYPAKGAAGSDSSSSSSSSSSKQLRQDQWVAMLLWPLLHKEDEDGQLSLSTAPAPERKQAALQRAVWRLPENLAVTLVGAATLLMPIHRFFKTYSAAFGVCAYCGLFANCAAALVLWLHGLHTMPSWNRPWLQNCLSDFWSRRWNLPAAYTLRALMFEPIMEGAWVKKTSTATTTASSSKEQPGSTKEASSGLQQPAAGSALAPAGAAEQQLQDTGLTTPKSTHSPQASSVDSPQGAVLVSHPAAAAGAKGSEEPSVKAPELVDVRAVTSHGQQEFKATVTRMGVAALEPSGHTVHTSHGDVQVTQDDGQPALVATASNTDMDKAIAEAELAADEASKGADSGLRQRKAAAPSTQDAAAGSATTKPAAGSRRSRRVSPLQRMAALAATFALSGALHEVLLLICTGWAAYRTVAGKQMAYFMLQVPASILEQIMAKSLKAAKIKVPDLIAIPFTSLSLQIPGYFLFWDSIFAAVNMARAS